MTIIDVLSQAPASLILGVLALALVFILLIPLALRLAGLTGQQVADTIKLTLQFFLDLVGEFRAQNKSSQ